MSEIKGKVAEILDRYTLVLNIGSESGVRQGMKFVIYELGESIRDPDTGKELGALEIVKGFVEVVNIQPKICTVRSSETKTETLPTFVWTTQRTQLVPLPIPEKTVGKSEDQKNIKIGDLARQIL